MIKMQYGDPAELVLDPVGQFLFYFPGACFDGLHHTGLVLYLEEADIDTGLQQIGSYLYRLDRYHSTINHAQSEPPENIIQFFLQCTCHLSLTLTFLHFLTFD